MLHFSPITRHYEIVILVHPDVADSGQEKLRSSIEGILTKFGGEILRGETWGKRKLAYEVAKQNRATYLYLNFLCQQTGIKELERTLRINDQVLKFQTVKLHNDATEVDLDAERNAKSALYMSPEDVASAERSYQRERDWANAASSASLARNNASSEATEAAPADEAAEAAPADEAAEAAPADEAAEAAPAEAAPETKEEEG